jgi:hypothetical protein
MRLNGLVEREEPGLSGRVFGHVGGFSGVETLIVEPRGLAGHQPRLLDLDFGLGQRMSDALMSADRHLPHLALAGVT